MRFILPHGLVLQHACFWAIAAQLSKLHLVAGSWQRMGQATPTADSVMTPAAQEAALVLLI